MRSSGTRGASEFLIETHSSRVGCSAQLTRVNVLGVTSPPGYPLASPDSCSIARTLDVLGDTWSVLVIREMFLGIHRFDQLQQNLDIARNVLAARLRRLVERGILSKRLYQEHPPRFEYHLTRKGVD